MTGRTGYEIREGSQMIRERIAAATGPCVGFSRELHADLVTAAVLRVRLPDLTEDLQSRAAALARQDGTRRLRVKGVSHVLD